jgi:hypothetical protein
LKKGGEGVMGWGRKKIVDIRGASVLKDFRDMVMGFKVYIIRSKSE